MAASDADRVNFFVSHAGPDARWAEWIDQTLRNAGFTTITDLYDFEAGQNFLVLMDGALRRADRVLLVWSPQANDRYMVEAEWTSAMASGRGRVIPVIVENCEMPPILSSLLHVDLTRFSDGETAGRSLVDALHPSRPDHPVRFPGAVSVSPGSAGQVEFPLDWSAARVGTRLLTPDKLLLVRGPVQETMVLEPDGSIKIGKKAASRASGTGRRYVADFVFSLEDGSHHFHVEFAKRPLTGYVRATALTINGSTVPITDHR